jgi:hypothetical protein
MSGYIAGTTACAAVQKFSANLDDFCFKALFLQRRKAGINKLSGIAVGSGTSVNR